MIVVDERFHSDPDPHGLAPGERVTAERPDTARLDGRLIADLLTHDAGLAMQALEAGRTMAAVGLSPERLKRMATTEELWPTPPDIWPDMDYAEQRSRAQRLQEIEAFQAGEAVAHPRPGP